MQLIEMNTIVFAIVNLLRIFRLWKITHKGINQVKESQINILYSYELFSMKIMNLLLRYSLGSPTSSIGSKLWEKSTKNYRKSWRF